MVDRELVFKAIRESWSRETCVEPDNYSPENPSRQQCDVSAFVAWEYLGGDLVLARVLLDGEQKEHHYWNRIDGEDFDLTREQFLDGEEIVEVDLLTNDFLVENHESMRPELVHRIGVLRERVHTRLTG